MQFGFAFAQRGLLQRSRGNGNVARETRRTGRNDARKMRMCRSLEIHVALHNVHSPWGAHLREPVVFFDPQPVAEIRHDDLASPQDVAQLHGVLETTRPSPTSRRVLRDVFYHATLRLLSDSWHTGAITKWGIAAARTRGCCFRRIFPSFLFFFWNYVSVFILLQKGR